MESEHTCNNSTVFNLVCDIEEDEKGLLIYGLYY